MRHSCRLRAGQDVLSGAGAWSASVWLGHAPLLPVLVQELQVSFMLVSIRRSSQPRLRSRVLLPAMIVRMSAAVWH